MKLNAKIENRCNMEKITSEKVKKDLEYIFDMAYQRDYKFGETNQSKRITQYISQLEVKAKVWEECYNDIFNMYILKRSQLDAVRELADNKFSYIDPQATLRNIRKILEGGTQ